MTNEREGVVRVSTSALARTLGSVAAACLLAGPFVPVAAALDARAQYAVDFWREGGGLPQNFVYTILQTRDGYLWLGTRGGLARFDGVRFTTYDDRRPDQLHDSEVHALAEDDDGSLWIGTHGGGLSHLRGGVMTSYSTKDGLASDSITSLAQSPRGPLWIGSMAGLTSFDGARFTTYTTKDGLPGDSIFELHLDDEGVLWIGTSRGLASFRDGAIVNHAAAHPELGGTVRAIGGRSADNGIWLDRVVDEDRLVGSKPRGLRRLKGDQVTTFSTRDGLPSDDVTALIEDADGIVWIGTTDGLARYRNGRVETILGQSGRGSLPPGTLPPRVIQCLWMDHEGSLWVGTRLDGLARLRNALFSNEGRGGTSSVIEDRAGAIWIAGVSGLSRTQDSVTTLFTLPGALPPGALAEDDRGRIWIGSSDGLFWIRSGRLERAALPLPGISVSVLLNDRRGSLWIGGRTSGLYEWRDERVTRYTPEDGLVGSQVRAIIADRDDGLWIGTKDGGVSRFKEGRFRNIGVKEGLPSPSVSALVADGDDVVWAATRRGLARIRGTEVSVVMAHQGLPTNYFYQIVEDGASDLWLTFAGGVARVSREELNNVADGTSRAARVSVFGTESGLRNTAMTISFQPSATRTRDGRLWFTNLDGVAVLDPRRKLRNAVAPSVHIEQTRTDATSHTKGGVIEVAPGQGNLEVHYTALSFLDPLRVQFKYRLEGFDRDWIEAGGRRVAYYTNLPRGRYRFQVKACNNDGVWNETGAAVDLRFLPHFYETSWFYGACAVTLALLGAGTQRVRVKRLQQRAQDLSDRVEESVAQMKILRGLLPICAWCKKIRDDGGYWNRMEEYIHEHSEADFSHSICPECAKGVRHEEGVTSPPSKAS